MKIRKATLSDLPVLLSFEQGVIKAERPFAPNLKKSKIHYYDLPALIESNDAQLLVIEQDNTLIASGYARLQKSKPHHVGNLHAYIGFIYVEPDYRGQKIAQRLIKALNHWAVEQGADELVLDVYEQNASAIKAYEQLGFQKALIEMRVNTDAVK